HDCDFHLVTPVFASRHQVTVATIRSFAIGKSFFCLRNDRHLAMKKGIRWESQIGRRLRLRDLHVLFAVVQFGSMAKAAAQLAVSQPVVSEAIADLEATIGVRLLDRSRRGATPTLYGQA